MMLDQWVRVVLGGHVLPDGSEVPEQAVYGLDGLAVTWGRTSPWEQPEASTLSIDIVLGPTPWPDWVRGSVLAVGGPVTVTGSVGAPPAADATVFVGTITDVAVSWDDGWSAPRATLTAVGTGRQAETHILGAAPFPAESAAARLARLESLAAPVTNQWATSRADLTGVGLVAQDVDAQPWADLVRDVAVAVDGAAWPVYGPDPTGRHGPGGGFLVEPLTHRPVVVTWHPAPDNLTTVVGPRIGAVPGGFTDLSACWTARAVVAWARAVDTLLTRVTVGWVEAAPVAGESPTERSVTVVDPARESTLGVQGAAINTLISTAEAAGSMATAVLVRSTPDAWTLTGVTLDAADLTDLADGAAFTATMTVLAREGLPVALTDLAAWAPVTASRVLAFVEGGTLRFTGGRWTSEVSVSSIGGTGVPAVWSDPPSPAPWTWAGTAPQVRWADTAVPIETIV